MTTKIVDLSTIGSDSDAVMATRRRMIRARRSAESPGRLRKVDSSSFIAVISSTRGRHWLIDCSDCGCDDALLADRAVLERRCMAECRDAGMQVVGSAFHQFTPAGVTGVVLLAESHCAVHTWPNERFAAIDVYVCNHERDNGEQGAALADAMARMFLPGRKTVREIERESVERDRLADDMTRSPPT